MDAIAARFTFEGAGLWEGDDPDLYPFPVPVVRVPDFGEVVRLPDESRRWQVAEVEHDYADGLNFTPTVRVRCVRV